MCYFPVSWERRQREPGTSYLTQEPQKLEAAVVDLELRRVGEAAHAIREGVEEVEEVLRHLASVTGSKWISR